MQSLCDFLLQTVKARLHGDEWPLLCEDPCSKKRTVNVETFLAQNQIINGFARIGGKLFMWYVTRVKDGAIKQDGTQMASENYESDFLKPEHAISMLTSPQHRDLAMQALLLVRATETALGRNII